MSRAFILNMSTVFRSFPNTPLSRSSSTIFRRSASACSPRSLMYTHSALTTSPLPIFVSPSKNADNCGDRFNSAGGFFARFLAPLTAPSPPPPPSRAFRFAAFLSESEAAWRRGRADSSCSSNARRRSSSSWDSSGSEVGGEGEGGTGGWEGEEEEGGGERGECGGEVPLMNALMRSLRKAFFELRLHANSASSCCRMVLLLVTSRSALARMDCTRTRRAASEGRGRSAEEGVGEEEEEEGAADELVRGGAVALGEMEGVTEPLLPSVTAGVAAGGGGRGGGASAEGEEWEEEDMDVSEMDVAATTGS